MTEAKSLINDDTVFYVLIEQRIKKDEQGNVMALELSDLSEEEARPFSFLAGIHALRNASPAHGRLNADSPRIAGDEGRDAEPTADIAGIDDVVLVEQIFGVRRYFPPALRRSPANADVRNAVGVLTQRVVEHRIVVLEVVLGLVAPNGRDEELA